MLNAHNLILGGIELGFGAAHGLTQTYETLGGRSQRRFLNGGGHVQSAWAKLRTVISGSGRVPPGLDSLDYTANLTLACAAPRSVSSLTTSITLPASRRTDVRPLAWAVVNGDYQRTGYSLVGNVLTCTAVTGATAYVAAYWPILTVMASPPSASFDARGLALGWELTAEEV